MAPNSLDDWLWFPRYHLVLSRDSTKLPSLFMNSVAKPSAALDMALSILVDLVSAIAFSMARSSRCDT